MDKNKETKVIKRNGTEVDFDENKIIDAIERAMNKGSGINALRLARVIAEDANDYFKYRTVKIRDIEKFVIEKLIDYGQSLTALAYEGYRKVKEYQRENPIDKKVMEVINANNSDIIDENSNKNAYIASTQRDLICGEVSKDYSRRKIFPSDIVYAHDSGIIHKHDMDYMIQNITNCCLINLKDMFENGTCINKRMIRTPKSFQTACTIMTQIIHQVTSSQFGGCTVSTAHLAPYLRKSIEKYKKQFTEIIIKKDEDNTIENLKLIDELVEDSINKELKAGIQTINYQLNTFSNSNGQSAFVSIFMYIEEEPEYRKENMMIIEEIFKQRIEGLENEIGVNVTPAFPKLLYVLDEDNIHTNSDHFYLTKLAVECVAKRMMPDFISAKIMKQYYEGNVFPCMGCRSWLSPWKDENGNYKFYGRFNIGVCTINLVDAGLSAKKNLDNFWRILDCRLELCKKALMINYEKLKKYCNSDVAPIFWQYGAVGRLPKHSKVDTLLEGGYATISLGYAGLHECVKALIGESHTTENGLKLALEIMYHLRDKCDQWKKETNLGFALYGTPLEATTYKFAKCLKERFGVIEGITDKDYITNSYHVEVNEEIDPFEKIKFESQFQKISSGGAVSYIEASNLNKNLEAVYKLIQYMYENILYAEINFKSDYCQVCGFDGEILMDKDLNWYCPNCGNRDMDKMDVCRRTCGYLGTNNWNKGRREEIANRYIHLDVKDADI